MTVDRNATYLLGTVCMIRNVGELFQWGWKNFFDFALTVRRGIVICNTYAATKRHEIPSNCNKSFDFVTFL